MNHFMQILVVTIMFAIVIINCLIYHYLKELWILIIEEELGDIKKKIDLKESEIIDI